MASTPPIMGEGGGLPQAHRLLVCFCASAKRITIGGRGVVGGHLRWSIIGTTNIGGLK